MGLIRRIGKTEKFPKYLIELFFDQHKNMISKVLYDRKTFDVVSLNNLTDTEKVELIPLNTKNMVFLRGEEFEQFIDKRNEFRKQMLGALVDGDEKEHIPTFVDYIFNGKLYITYYVAEDFMRFLLNVDEINEHEDMNLGGFSKEELTYPSVLFYLRNSIKFRTVSLFLMVGEDDKTSSFVIYKTNEHTFTGFIDKDEVDVLEMKVFDKDYKELDAHPDAENVKIEMESFLYKRNIARLAKEYVPQIKE